MRTITERQESELFFTHERTIDRGDFTAAMKPGEHPRILVAGRQDTTFKVARVAQVPTHCSYRRIGEPKRKAPRPSDRDPLSTLDHPGGWEDWEIPDTTLPREVQVVQAAAKSQESTTQASNKTSSFPEDPGIISDKKEPTLASNIEVSTEVSEPRELRVSNREVTSFQLLPSIRSVPPLNFQGTVLEGVEKITTRHGKKKEKNEL
jgi:hypothetical protein